MSGASLSKLTRVPIAPVVALPADGPALDPIKVRHAGPRVVAAFSELLKPASERVERPKVEVHVVKLKRRRRSK
jgi:hypothetical protein